LILISASEGSVVEVSNFQLPTSNFELFESCLQVVLW
jgi:hypothetical protein